MIKGLFLKKDARICNKIDISEISFEIASATALGYLEKEGHIFISNGYFPYI